MTIASVAVDDPVEAATANQLIDNVNASPGRAIFTSNGTWSVPSGVHKFKVTLCGGGGHGEGFVTVGGGEDSYIVAGANGGDAPMVSSLFSGVELGTSYVITIGAAGAYGGTGGTTSFGTALTSTGGGSASGTTAGGRGSTTVSGGSTRLYHDNGILTNSAGAAYGSGGVGTTGSAVAGMQGIVVVEW